MSKRALGIITGFVAIALIAGILIFNSQKSSAPSSDNNSQSSSFQSNSNDNSQQTSTDKSKAFTKEEVAKHTSKSDCWTIIDGKVYDLTSFIPQHPGGDEILQACGKDGSVLFNSRETEGGEQVGSGTPHSNTARSMLDDLQIGTLAP